MSRTVCSFCGKSEESVQHLVAGPRGVAICNECVRICVDVNQAGFGSDGDLLITSIGELVTNDRFVEGLTGRISDAAIAVRAGVIRWAGPELALPNRYRDLPTVDCEGRAVLPGLIDADTRSLFGGEQGEAFRDLQADPSEFRRSAFELTQAATRATTTDRLSAELSARFTRMSEHGTTSVVAGSHFGSTPSEQARLVEIAIHLDASLPIDVVTCDLLLSSVNGLIGTDYTEVSHTLEPDMVELLRSHGQSVRYRPGHSRVDPGVLASYGISRLVLNDNELDNAVVEHLAQVGGSVIVTPSVNSTTSARDAWDQGLTVALATGCDPISRYTESMQTSIALAVRSWGLTVDQAIWSATRGSALVIDSKEKGWIGRGAVADLVILDAPSASHLAYRVGTNLVWRTIKNGIATGSERNLGL